MDAQPLQIDLEGPRDLEGTHRGFDFREAFLIFANSRLFRVSSELALQISKRPVQMVDTTNMQPPINRTREADDGNQRRHHRKHKENDPAEKRRKPEGHI